MIADQHVSDRHTVEKVLDKYVNHGIFELVRLSRQVYCISQYFDEVSEKKDSKLDEHLASCLLDEDLNLL